MKSGKTICISAAFLAALIGAAAPGHAADSAAPKVTVGKDGTVYIPAFAVPLSSYMSDKAKQIYIESMLNPAKAVTDQGIAKHRETHNQVFYKPRLEKAEKRYPINIEDARMGGVHVEIITPKSGVADKNKNRVLMEVHGGSFSLGAIFSSRLESMPIANVGGFKIVSIDYRQGPEHKFPAASEDVAAVYRELLKTYKPENIGLFGCSGGGVLTAQALAWFQKEKLPRPGAAGLFCAAAESFSGGDAKFWGLPLDVFFSDVPPPPSPNPAPFPMAYFSDVNLKDSLVAPLYHLDVLAKFPPTLLVTGTRGIDVSSAAYTHTQMAKAGAESYFYAWEGMWHAFLYDVEVPEAQDAYNVIVKFFDKHLGK